MHEVQTWSFLVVPPPAGVRTDWMFGFQRRLVRRCEWDTLWPKPGPLPQTSHTLATVILLRFEPRTDLNPRTLERPGLTRPQATRPRYLMAWRRSQSGSRTEG